MRRIWTAIIFTATSSVRTYKICMVPWVHDCLWWLCAAFWVHFQRHRLTLTHTTAMDVWNFHHLFLIVFTHLFHLWHDASGCTHIMLRWRWRYSRYFVCIFTDRLLHARWTVFSETYWHVYYSSVHVIDNLCTGWRWPAYLHCQRCTIH